MPTPAHFITCTKKTLLAPGVYELVFTKPGGFSFKAGQFVLFDVPLQNNPSDIQPRAFSIASIPSEDDLLFVVKMKEGGRASMWIEETLTTGMQVRIQGPFGLFLVKDATKEAELVFVATGAGIAPFRSQIMSALREHGDKRKMDLFFGVRHTEDFFWLETFEKLTEEFPQFTFHPVLSGNRDEWSGKKGRVQMHLKDVVTPTSGIYICGAPEMVKDVKTMCLEQLLCPKAQVHAEGYI